MPASKQTSDLQFPFGGLVKSSGYQHQAPYTSASLNNVRPRDPTTGRLRGGARPMLAKALSTQIGSGNPVRLLAPVTSPATSRTFTEPFSGTALASTWTKWSAGGYTPAVFNSRVHADASDTTAIGYRHSAFGTFDDTQPWSLEMDVDVSAGLSQNAYYIFFQRDNSSTAFGFAAGYYAGIAFGATYGIGSSREISVFLYRSGSSVSTVLIEDDAANDGLNGTVRVEVVPGTSVKVYWRGLLVVSAAHTTSANKYVGFGFQNAAPQDAGAIDTFRFNYISTITAGTEKLLASANAVWYLENAGAFTTLSTTVAGNASAVMQSAPYLGQLFVVNCTTPLYFDYDDSDTHDWAAAVVAGSLPLNPKIICQWNGRIVVGDGSNVYYMARQDNPFDFDYGAVDSDRGRAMAGVTGDVDILGEAIKAYIPFSRDYLLMGCLDSMWMMAGDPAAGGRFVNVSRTVGVVGPNAWCITPDNVVVFLSRYGLYVVQPGGVPVPISDKPLPRELLDISTSSYLIQLQYDVYDQGVHIYLTPVGLTAGSHWFVDWQDRTFWPCTYAATHQPVCSCTYSGFSGSGSKVLLGGSAGYVRRHSDAATTDDGTTCSSYVFYGPFPLGGPLLEGSVDQLEAVLSDAASNVAWEVRTASSGVAALAATARSSGTWEAGRNHTDRPRGRGASGALKLSSDGPWAIEELQMTRAVRGRIRL